MFSGNPREPPSPQGGHLISPHFFETHERTPSRRRCKRWVAAKSPASDQGDSALTLRGSISSGCRSHLCKKAAEWFIGLLGKIAIQCADLLRLCHECPESRLGEFGLNFHCLVERSHT